jgi:uncharacterized protein YecE (DUF72 family)
MQPRFFIGTSGWHYEHWRGRFYPQGLAKSKWLEFYAQHFPTAELNNSFYRLPSENAFANWRDSSPHDFLFAVKVSRFITHIKKLRNADEAVNTFLSRATLLQEKLGPLLYQLPPNVKRNDEVLRSFLSILPQDLAHVFEFRNKSWLEDEVFQMLREHNVGFCVFDMPGLTTPLVATSDFAYIRFHGSTFMYGGCYSDEELQDWAQRIAEMSQGLKAAYIYFNNDAEAFAVQNAQTLTEYLVSR